MVFKANFPCESTSYFSKSFKTSSQREGTLNEQGTKDFARTKLLPPIPTPIIPLLFGGFLSKCCLCQ